MLALRSAHLIIAFIATTAPIAHALEMISKLTLDGPLWLGVQRHLYRGWGEVFGPVEIIAFLSTLALPPPGTGRIQALIRLWAGGTIMATAIINLLSAVFDYAPKRPGPAPTAGFLLAGFVLSMFISCGFWGAVAPILSREFAIRGALVTGALLFVIVAAVGLMLFG